MNLYGGLYSGSVTVTFSEKFAYSSFVVPSLHYTKAIKEGYLFP